jgi:hypothetical protein
VYEDFDAAMEASIQIIPTGVPLGMHGAPIQRVKPENNHVIHASINWIK